MIKECLQLRLPKGTPCFENGVKRTVCPLDFCPTADYLHQNPEENLWNALHTHGVMSDSYVGDVGRGIYIETIAKLRLQGEQK
ncbi:hypothetical protein ACFLZ1_02905 [Patescibacteria group bacterium]